MLDYSGLNGLAQLASGSPVSPSVPSLSQVQEQVATFKQLTRDIPAIARQDPEAFQKAWKTMSKEQAARSPKSAFFDPLSIQYALGYKDRRYSLTYDTLRNISHQLGIVAAIINTRIAQIAAFSQPYRITKSLGFQVRHKDTEHETTRSERRFIKHLEEFVSACGEPGKQNPHTKNRRPKFEAFIKMLVRDSLTYDQTGFEVVPRRNGLPFEFRIVDAQTLRMASTDNEVSELKSYHQRNSVYTNASFVNRYSGLYEGMQYGQFGDPLNNAIQYVQVVNGQIENVYTDDELAFGVRNPRSDIYIQGYGFGELEQLITIVTSMLYAESYNKMFFTNGAHPKGILNFKGDNWAPDQLECVSGDSIILTDLGSFDIENLYRLQNTEGHKFKFWSGTEYGEGFVSESGIKRLHNIRLEDGSKLRATENHRVFVLTDSGEEERFVADLQAGDILLQNEASAGELELPLDKLIDQTSWKGSARGPGKDFFIEEIGADLWEVLGWFTRDGWMSSDKSLILLMYNSKKDREAFDRHGSILSKYGVSFKKSPKMDLAWQICHKTFGEFLSAIGFQSGKKTEIPSLVFSQCFEKRCSYLRGHFSANGYVFSHGYSVGLASVHSGIVEGTQQLLNTVGLCSYICVASNGATQVVLRRRQEFSKLIGFIQEYKMSMIKPISEKARTPSDAVPIPLLRTLLSPYRDVLDKDSDLSRKKAGMSILNQQQAVRISSRLYWREFFLSVGDNEAVRLLSHRFVRVSSIEEDSCEMTYDVTITKGSPRFVANGIVTHNSFKRQWMAQLNGASNSWKTPIMQSEGIEWVNMQMTNQDMQFNVWLEYLIKVASAVFLIDPAEINFDLHGGVQQTPLFESSQEWKLKASRDRGLKPLLRFIAGLINEHVIEKIDDHFVFEFVGLDELTEQEKHEMLKEQISSYMTLNEGRRSLDLPDIDVVGDFPMNPAAIQLLQMLDAKKDREDRQAKEEEEQQREREQQEAQEQQGGEEQQPDPKETMKQEAHQQRLQQSADRHPLEMELLRQKAGMAAQQSAESPAQDQQAVPPQGQEELSDSTPEYTDLFGKALDFDDFIEAMRKKKSKED
jgi:hypothetical protein